MPRGLPHQDGRRAIVAAARAVFDRAFGRAPEVACAAPGRVNIIGDHVDYCGGVCLPMAIDRHTVVCAGRGPRGRELRVVSAAYPSDPIVVDLDADLRGLEPRWVRYPVGVAALLRKAGVDAGGVDLAVASHIPLGAGLSSSAAIEVATCLAVERLAGGPGLSPMARVQLTRTAEQQYAGVPCGIMDQYTVTLAKRGSVLLLDCARATHRDIPLDPRLAFVLVDSGVRHELATDAYADRRAVCERALAEIRRVSASDPPASLGQVTMAGLDAALARGASLSATDRRRVRHVISECGRTRDAGAALSVGDGGLLGRLMRESHASLRDDYEVSCPEVDQLVTLACGTPGVLGARMTGGGFGGCVVVLAEAQRAESVAAEMRRCAGPDRLVLRVHAAAGAAVVDGART